MTARILMRVEYTRTVLPIKPQPLLKHKLLLLLPIPRPGVRENQSVSAIVIATAAVKDIPFGFVLA